MSLFLWLPIPTETYLNDWAGNEKIKEQINEEKNPRNFR